MAQQRIVHGLKLSVLSLGLALGAGLWRGGAAVRAQHAAAEPSVEQAHPHVQVLKALPESQLIPLMNYINAALGVECNYCHVQGDKDPQTGRTRWDWASDAKEEKVAARRMMLMTMSLNQTNRMDLGSTGVTCYTCHRGAAHPQNLPTLPLTSAAHEPGPGAPPAPAAGGPGGPGARPTRPPLPTVQQVVERYVAAVGGAAAVAKVQTRVMRGTREASQDRNWPIEVTLKGADRYLAMVTTPQGTLAQSYNGATGWSKNPQGAHAASAEELTSMKDAAHIYDLIQISAPAPDMRVVGLTKVGDREAYVVRSTPSPGVTERLFFDKETGLLLRRLTLTSTMLSPLPEQVDYEDYRDVAGVKVPFTIRVSSVDRFSSSTRKFTEIKFNEPVDDKNFALPAAAAPGGAH